MMEGGEREIDVHPDLIAIVDELFDAVVIDKMTTKTFFCLVGDCVGQDKMNKKVKGAFKERLTDLMEAERRKGSKAAPATREEDKEEKERRSTRDSKPTEKMAAYLGNLHPPSKINARAIFTIRC